MNASILIAAMAVTTALLRFIPFIAFRKKTPEYITYLGKVLPPAMIGLLVVFCLKDTSIAAYPFGMPELIAAATVIGAQIWKRNAIISILTGTVVYMVLVQMVF